MGKIAEWMEVQNTAPKLQQCLLGHLNQWRMGRRYVIAYDTPARLRRAMRQQEDIGWHNMILGRHHKRFQIHQQNHYLKIKSQRSGLRWAVALNKKLMGVAWDMWQHRNSILHNTSDNFHTKMLVAEADLAISREFKKNNRNILKRDKNLFKGKRRTKQMSLMDKGRWLDAVSGARKAWTIDQNSMPTLAPERVQLAVHLEITI